MLKTLRCAVSNSADALFSCTESAAKEHSGFVFSAMAQDPAAAVVAGGRELIDRTLEAVEDVRLSGQRNLECLVVAVAANFAGRHM